MGKDKTILLLGAGWTWDKSSAVQISVKRRNSGIRRHKMVSWRSAADRFLRSD